MQLKTLKKLTLKFKLSQLKYPVFFHGEKQIFLKIILSKTRTKMNCVMNKRIYTA